MKTNYFLFFLTTIIFLISFSNANAQFENKKYQTESIYFKGSKYVKNGIEYRIGFLGKNLKKEMEVSPNAVIEYNIFEKKRNTALILSSIGLATLVSAIFVDNKDIQTGLIIGGIGLTIVSFPFTTKASNSFQKAVWIRNGEILK